MTTRSKGARLWSRSCEEPTRQSIEMREICALARRGGDHLVARVDADHGAGVARKGDRERPRAAAEIEHA